MTTIHAVTSHRWRVAASSFTVRTEDGVRQCGTRLDAATTDAPVRVLAHGLMGWHRKPRFARFAERMGRRFTVYAPDLRGHGQSGADRGRG